MVELGTRRRGKEDAAEDKQKKNRGLVSQEEGGILSLEKLMERTREHDDNFDASSIIPG